MTQTQGWIMATEPHESVVGRYRLTFEVFNVAAYSDADARHLAEMYLDRIKGLAPNDVTLAGVERQT
jgi:hypothetical protein